MILSCNHEYSCLLSPNMSMFLMSEAQNRLWLTDRWWWRLSIFMLQSLAMIKMYTGFVNAHRDGVIISQIAKFTLLHLIWIQLSSVYLWYKITTAAASRHFMLQDPTILRKPQQALSDSRKEKLWRPETQTKTCKLDTETGGGYRRHTWPPWNRANSAALLLFFCDTYTQKEQKTFKKDNLLQTLHSMFVRNQRAHPLCLGLTLICWVCAGNLYGSTLIYIHEEIFS